MAGSPGEILEQAIAADPGDIAAHAAYADWLIQQGDPRGELIQVQLSLEDESRPANERAELQKRERELLRRHASTWLGDVGRFLVGKWSGADKSFHYQFVRGWLDLVRVLPAPDAILAALGRAPEARMLRRLEIVYDMRYHPFDFDLTGPNAALKRSETANEIFEAANLMPPLLASPYLTNLRAFKLGFDDGPRIGHSTMVMPFQNCNVEQMIELLTKCPRLEELYLNDGFADISRLFASPKLGNLRLLQYYYGSDYAGGENAAAYPLTVLANNRSLQRLTTLRLHAGRDTTIDLDQMDAVLRSPHLPSLSRLQVHMTVFGDEGSQRIIGSGALRRLKLLDIGYGNMTDAGARLLAACPDLKNLAILDVSRNALTDDGIAALRATGISVIANDQHGPDEQDYLYEVDLE